MGGACSGWPQRNGKRLSSHCWAIAVDLDVADNPLDGANRMHSAGIAAFQTEGFEWG